MPSEELLKLAEELKEAREKTEISLHQIASKTRIDIKFLKAIEEGNFSIMPEVYIRAFIKEYAALCELDPIKTLEKYDLAKEGKLIELNIIEEETGEATEKHPHKKKTFVDDTIAPKADSTSRLNTQKILFIGVLVVLIILVIASYFLFIKNSAPDIVVEKPFEEVLSEQKQRYEIADENPKAALTQTDSLNLSIKATDTCWVNVTIDESVDKEFMLYNNTSVVIKALSKFDLIVGNAGGINIELNGAPINFNGSEGQRKIFSINKDGLINSSN